jgi:UDP-N-acetylenolpyruvoylglucosamine reductase
VSTADVDIADRFHDLIRIIIATGCPNLENEMLRPEKEGGAFIRNVGYLPSWTAACSRKQQ